MYRPQGEAIGILKSYGLRYSLAGENRPLVDKTDGISERIFKVETVLAPRTECDFRFDLLAVQSTCSFKHFVNVRHREINMIRVWSGVEIISIASRIKASQNHATAVEVMSTRADSLATC